MKRLTLAALLCLISLSAHAQVFNPPTLLGLGGLATDASNATLPAARNALQVTRVLTDFGAVCDGTTDDLAAFTAATLWLKTAANRKVMIPAGPACASSLPVTYGDGRQHSTTLSGGLSGGETTIPVSSIVGAQSGDTIVIVRDDDTIFTTVLTATPAGGDFVILGGYGGAFSGAAASGNVVYTGKVSSYNGGGFRGYGSCATNAEWPGGGAAVSTIKYIGAAAPATTLSATANIGDLTLTVAAIANFSLGDPVGVTLDNGRVWWTTVARSPVGTTVYIVNEIPSAATSGNAVTIANNPVLKVAGPILFPAVEGICLDANSLAGVGLMAIHPVGGKFQGPRGVAAINYTGIGHFLSSASAYLGPAVGTMDNDFELYALKPANTHTIGGWFRGHAARNVAFSRNRFHGGAFMMGGADVTAAGLREEWADNNFFIKPYTLVNGASNSGAGLYRQPSVGLAVGLGENHYAGAALVGGVTEGTATGGGLYPNYFAGYAVSDGEVVPTGSSSRGITSQGTAFGYFGLRDTSALFDVQLQATSSTPLTANRILTVDLVNAARTIKLTGDLTIGGALNFANIATANQLLYVTSAQNVGGLATANSGVLITSAAGVPSISSTLPSAVQANITTTGALAAGSIASGFGTIATANTITTTNATASTSTATGAALIAGGMGVGANIYGGGGIHVMGCPGEGTPGTGNGLHFEFGCTANVARIVASQPGSSYRQLQIHSSSLVLSGIGGLTTFGATNVGPAHIASAQQTAPALTSCGTGSPAIVGTDTAGTITLGTAATGCVITFNAAYVAAPHCIVTWQATPLLSQSYTVSNTAITLVQTSASGNLANYVCVGRSGG